jgi:branched-chain amino acid transport system substrate-binding protein
MYFLLVKRINVTSANGAPETQLDRLKQYRENCVNLVIGGSWSSQAELSLQYLDENDMLMISPGSTVHSLAVPGNNMIRLCPDNVQQGRAIAEVITSWGSKAVIVIQRGDDASEETTDGFSEAFLSAGGVISGRVTLNVTEQDFSGVLSEAEGMAEEAVSLYVEENVTVLALCLHEAADIAALAEDYPTLYSLTWFGGEGTARNVALSGDAPMQAAHLRFLSLQASPTESSMLQSLRDRFMVATGVKLDSYTDELEMANYYDAVIIYANAIQMAGSLDTDKVRGAVFSAADSVYTTGLCRLNEAGDRDTCNYVIWGYNFLDGKGVDTSYGLYDSLNNSVTWDTNVLGFTPPD